MKLQQQALPVVKDFVAEWYEENKKDLDFAIFDFCVELDKLDETSTKFESWFDNSLNNPIETLIRMKDGYTVEKPQLFYLCEKNTGYYLRKTGNDWYGITPHYSNDYDENYMNYKFTQQEINNIDTGSYELVPVEDGE